MTARNFKCAIDMCGEKEKGGTIKGKEYCQYHFNKFVLTQPIKREQKKHGRNTPCNCGSGKKFKNCCMITQKKNHHFYTNREGLVV